LYLRPIVTIPEKPLADSSGLSSGMIEHGKGKDRA